MEGVRVPGSKSRPAAPPSGNMQPRRKTCAFCFLGLSGLQIWLPLGAHGMWGARSRCQSQRSHIIYGRFPGPKGWYAEQGLGRSQALGLPANPLGIQFTSLVSVSFRLAQCCESRGCRGFIPLRGVSPQLILSPHPATLSCYHVSGTGLGWGEYRGDQHLSVALHPGLCLTSSLPWGSSGAEGLKCLFGTQACTI